MAEGDDDTATNTPLELTELTTLTFNAVDCPPPFAIGTDNHRDFTVNNRTQCCVIQLKYDTADEDHLKLQLSVCNASADKPTASLLSVPHLQLKSTNEAQLSDLLLDAVMLPQLAPDPIDAVYTALQFCDAPAALLLAGLTNFGALHVYTKQLYDRRWSHQLADVSALWLARCQRVKPTWHDERVTCNEYVRRVHDLQFVTFAWQRVPRNSSTDGSREHLLVAVTASGRAVFCAIAAHDLESSQNARLVFSAELSHNSSQVSHVRWNSERPNRPSYLCIADTLGNVRLYTVNVSVSTTGADVTGLHHLVDCVRSNIPMRIGALHLERHSEGSAPIVLICMATKVLICNIHHTDSTDSVTVHLHPHSLPKQIITGCARVGPNQYAICTYAGTVQLLTLDDETGVRSVRTVRTSINTEKYHLAGMATTQQQALWFFVLFPRQPFDHLVLRQPLIASVCTPPAEFVMRRLQRPAEQRGEHAARVSDLHDCAEVFRYRQLRQNALLPYVAPTFGGGRGGGGGTDDATVYALRVHLMALHSLSGYYRRSHRHRTDELNEEIAYVHSTLIVIMYCRQLVRMLAHDATPAWTDPQRLAARCMRRALAEYMGDTDFGPIPDACYARYETMGSNLRDAFLQHAATEDANNDDAAAATEECNQCDAAVPVGATRCAAGHTIGRCCVSAMLVPIISRHGCRQCNCVALESDEQLRIATGSSPAAVFMCPVCDVPLVR